MLWKRYPANPSGFLYICLTKRENQYFISVLSDLFLSLFLTQSGRAGLACAGCRSGHTPVSVIASQTSRLAVAAEAGGPNWCWDQRGEQRLRNQSAGLRSPSQAVLAGHAELTRMLDGETDIQEG